MCREILCDGLSRLPPSIGLNYYKVFTWHEYIHKTERSKSLYIWCFGDIIWICFLTDSLQNCPIQNTRRRVSQIDISITNNNMPKWIVWRKDNYATSPLSTHHLLLQSWYLCRISEWVDTNIITEDGWRIYASLNRYDPHYIVFRGNELKREWKRILEYIPG